MPVATAMIVAKEAPKPGKVRGRAKDSNNIVYQVPPSLMGLINVGTTYELTYKDDQYRENKFRVIESVIPAMNLSPQQISQPPVQPASYRSPVAGMPINAPTTKDEDISTLAIAKEQLNKIQPGDIEAGFHILKSSALMWRKFKNWQRTQDSDMDGDSVG